MRDDERELFASELDSFVPPRLVDAHCHWWTSASGTAERPGLSHLPACTGREEYLRLAAEILPDRSIGALALPLPWAPDVRAESEWIAREASAAGDSPPP